jgi:type IV pilus assembly protein PilO
MRVNLSSIQWKDPRVVMRGILGLLLAANLVGAVIAFKPFGGSADDLRRERASLQQQLTQLQKQVAGRKQLVEKVQYARTEGNVFLEKYITDRHVVTSTIEGELVSMAEASGIVFQPTSENLEPIDGSDSISQMTINAGCQGNYQALAKFLNQVDRSPRFLIIESLTASPLQSGDRLNVALKIDTFVRGQGDQPAGGAEAGEGGQ